MHEQRLLGVRGRRAGRTRRSRFGLLGRPTIGGSTATWFGPRAIRFTTARPAASAAALSGRWRRPEAAEVLRYGRKGDDFAWYEGLAYRAEEELLVTLRRTYSRAGGRQGFTAVLCRDDATVQRESPIGALSGTSPNNHPIVLLGADGDTWLSPVYPEQRVILVGSVSNNTAREVPLKGADFCPLALGAGLGQLICGVQEVEVGGNLPVGLRVGSGDMDRCREFADCDAACMRRGPRRNCGISSSVVPLRDPQNRHADYDDRPGPYVGLQHAVRLLFQGERPSPNARPCSVRCGGVVAVCQRTGGGFASRAYGWGTPLHLTLSRGSCRSGNACAAYHGKRIRFRRNDE